MNSMVIQEESKDIIEDSPFNRLVLAEMERERLYSTFALVDEFNEIASSWLEFSDFCAKSLFNLANLSFLLYERYLDEFNRDKQQIEINFERKNFIIKRIENLQQFQMEAAILMILYADIVNTGIFASNPAKNFCYLNIEGYKVLEKISSTYFDTTHPRASSIEDIMVKLFTISQKVQIVKILNDSPIKKAKETSFIQEQLELERLLADFEFNFISKLIEELGKRWWWYDPIAVHFSYERAMKHLEKTLTLLEYSEENVLQIKEEINIKLSTIDKIWRNKTLIDHFYRITLEAAKKDNFIASIEYLNLILGLIDEIVEYLQDNIHSENEEQLNEEIQERKTDLKIFHIVAKLAFSVAEIINRQTSIDDKWLKEKLTEIENICKDSSLFSSLSYLSEIVYIYQSFVQTAKIGILKKQKIDKILNNAIAQFEYYIVKLENGLKKIANDFYKKVHKGTIKSTDFKNYLKSIEELKYISFFLPNLEQKLNLTREIESMECYIKSIAVLEQSQSLELSEIEKLIYYSKAHYFSNKALDLSQSKEKAIIPDIWLEEQFLKTFTEGREVELKLFELSRQFLFLNKVIDEIAYCFDISEKRQEKIENYGTIIQFHFRKFELFEIINKQIEENCLETLKYKEMADETVSIRDKNINWQIIEAKKILASSADKLTKALKKCALGYAADRVKDNYKAAVLFNESYKLVQEACNILDPLTAYDEQFADLAKTTYEFNLFLKELERLELEKKKINEFPLEKVLSLIKKIIFFS
ncbi:MAG: hypothetical protein K9W46_06750 [Candidatus Heimdallarchaeum endolithica]|uniref:Uncharacterized protein n=1 Tax=Candidatus Heimdallarchaeum endolithica TaxID=2876572 RepID=A0A9Y1FQD8_9ARCH|nr:MAG: hypothetical protein K9W46_06750 [Candidatus Heimdallarchaeum endolithica]